MIMTGVASTGGSIASLNRLARCSGRTTIVKEPRVPTGTVRITSALSEPRPLPERVDHAPRQNPGQTVSERHEAAHRYGSAASRNPSPKKLKARITTITGTTGSISHG